MVSSKKAAPAKRGAKRIVVDKKMLSRVFEMASNLLTDKQIFESLGISCDTFYELKKNNSEFSEALTLGREKTRDELTNAAIKNAKMEPSLMMFMMRTKFDYMYVDKRKELELKQKELELKTKSFLTGMAKEFNLTYEQLDEFANKYFNGNKSEEK